MINYIYIYNLNSNTNKGEIKITDLIIREAEQWRWTYKKYQ